MVDRIIPDIFVQIELILIPHRVGLHEPAQRRRVEPGLVIIHAELGQERLPGVLEPPDIAGGGDAVFIVAVDRGQRTARAAERDDAALRVGVEPVAVVRAGALIPDERLVLAKAVDVAPQRGAVAVDFGDEVGAVVEQPAVRRAVIIAEQAVAGIVDQLLVGGADIADRQPVLGIVLEPAGAVRDEVCR